jgi:hypothetical protein
LDILTFRVSKEANYKEEEGYSLDLDKFVYTSEMGLKPFFFVLALLAGLAFSVL